MQTIRRTRTAAACFILICLAWGAKAQIFVNHAAAGANDGSTWTDAYTDLQAALDAAAEGEAIWVAEGTYYPSKNPQTGATTGRDRAFHVDKDIKLYAGFAGTESLLGSRDPDAHPCILSGDLGVLASTSDDAYHIFVTAALSHDAIIDGFRFEGGQANGSTSGSALTYAARNYYRYVGGALYNTYSSPSVVNCSFSGNVAVSNGGAVYNQNAAPHFIGCTFSGNTSGETGGAMCNEFADAVISGSDFSQNTANDGGGAIYNNYCGGSISECHFLQNTTSDNGGGVILRNGSNTSLTECRFEQNTAMHDGGGLFLYNKAVPNIVNCQFSENEAGNNGGAIYAYFKCNYRIINSSFWANSAPNAGGAIYHYYQCSPDVLNCTLANNSGGSSSNGMYNRSSSSPNITNCLFWESGSDIANATSAPNIAHTLLSSAALPPACVDGGSNIFATDPLFSDAANGDLSLSAGSPAISAGVDSANVEALDLAGNARKNDTIDLGAYEYYSLPLPVELLFFEVRTWAGQEALLEWATASEQGHAGFDIEHSRNGHDWRHIAWVAGTGDSQQRRDYAWRHAVGAAGWHYYRLRQNDHDGTATYSPIRSLRIDDEQDRTLLALYPNPASAELRVDLAAAAEAFICDATGRTQWQGSWAAGPQRVELGNWPAGTYVLHLRYTDGRQHSQLFAKR